MEDLALVRDLAVVWLAALLAGSLCIRLRLPVIAGYILAGLAIGPFGAKLIDAVPQIKMLAELGVALLLFALGVELSLKKVFAGAGRVTVAGLCQVLSTVLIACAIVMQSGGVTNLSSGLVFGLICALSSTAVVTKIIVDRAESETTHGRVIVPMLLIQDLSLVPVVALLPALQGSSGGSVTLLLTALGKAGILMAFVAIGALWIVPRILTTVSKSNSRELFLLTGISLCLVVALASNLLGVSLALGAFLSGIMVSERPFGHQIMADIVPLRDLFATVFFVAVGMLLNPVFIAMHWAQVAIFVVLLLVGKTLLGGLSAFIATRNVWSSVLVGVGLAQIGEFSFVLATLAHSAGLLPIKLYNLFFAGAVVTLVLSPALIAIAPKLMAKLPYFRLARRTDDAATAPTIAIDNHLILCGFGRMGKSIGLALHSALIPFVVVELDGQATEELAANGIRHIYGDVFNHLVLGKANLSKAACLVLTIPDVVVTTHVITYARSQNPDIHIIARASHPGDTELFRQAGANAVVQPEFEASLEATKMALTSMQRSREEVLDAMREIRQRGNALFGSAENVSC